MAIKALLIDDNEQDRWIMKRFLAKAGIMEVITAEEGEEGIRKARTERPDIIILDTVLPKMDGFEICKKIRADVKNRQPKIIMLTGSVDAIDVIKARLAGADDYCVKTSDGAPLLEALKNIFAEEK